MAGRKVPPTPPHPLLSQRKNCPDLSVPESVEILHGEGLLLDHEAQDLLQLLGVLGLVQAVAQHDGQNVVLLDPFLQATQATLPTTRWHTVSS